MRSAERDLPDASRREGLLVAVLTHPGYVLVLEADDGYYVRATGNGFNC